MRKPDPPYRGDGVSESLILILSNNGFIKRTLIVVLMFKTFLWASTFGFRRFGMAERREHHPPSDQSLSSLHSPYLDVVQTSQKGCPRLDGELAKVITKEVSFVVWVDCRLPIGWEDRML